MICYTCRLDKPLVSFHVCEEAGTARTSRLCEECRANKARLAKKVPDIIKCTDCREEKPKENFRTGETERYTTVCQDCRDDGTSSQRYQNRQKTAKDDMDRVQSFLSSRWTPETETP